MSRSTRPTVSSPQDTDGGEGQPHQPRSLNPFFLNTRNYVCISSKTICCNSIVILGFAFIP